MNQAQPLSSRLDYSPQVWDLERYLTLQRFKERDTGPVCILSIYACLREVGPMCDILQCFAIKPIFKVLGAQHPGTSVRVHEMSNLIVPLPPALLVHEALTGRPMLDSDDFPSQCASLESKSIELTLTTSKTLAPLSSAWRNMISSASERTTFEALLSSFGARKSVTIYQIYQNESPEEASLLYGQ